MKKTAKESLRDWLDAFSAEADTLDREIFASTLNAERFDILIKMAEGFMALSEKGYPKASEFLDKIFAALNEGFNAAYQNKEEKIQLQREYLSALKKNKAFYQKKLKQFSESTVVKFDDKVSEGKKAVLEQVVKEVETKSGKKLDEIRNARAAPNIPTREGVETTGNEIPSLKTLNLDSLPRAHYEDVRGRWSHIESEFYKLMDEPEFADNLDTKGLGFVTAIDSTISLLRDVDTGKRVIRTASKLAKKTSGKLQEKIETVKLVKENEALVTEDENKETGAMPSKNPSQENPSSSAQDALKALSEKKEKKEIKGFQKALINLIKPYRNFVKHSIIKSVEKRKKRIRNTSLSIEKTGLSYAEVLSKRILVGDIDAVVKENEQGWFAWMREKWNLMSGNTKIKPEQLLDDIHKKGEEKIEEYIFDMFQNTLETFRFLDEKNLLRTQELKNILKRLSEFEIMKQKIDNKIKECDELILKATDENSLKKGLQANKEHLIKQKGVLSDSIQNYLKEIAKNPAVNINKDLLPFSILLTGSLKKLKKLELIVFSASFPKTMYEEIVKNREGDEGALSDLLNPATSETEFGKAQQVLFQYVNSKKEAIANLIAAKAMDRNMRLMERFKSRLKVEKTTEKPKEKPILNKKKSKKDLRRESNASDETTMLTVKSAIQSIIDNPKLSEEISELKSGFAQELKKLEISRQSRTDILGSTKSNINKKIEKNKEEIERLEKEIKNLPSEQLKELEEPLDSRVKTEAELTAENEKLEGWLRQHQKRKEETLNEPQKKSWFQVVGEYVGALSLDPIEQLFRELKALKEQGNEEKASEKKEELETMIVEITQKIETNNAEIAEFQLQKQGEKEEIKKIKAELQQKPGREKRVIEKEKLNLEQENIQLGTIVKELSERPEALGWVNWFTGGLGGALNRLKNIMGLGNKPLFQEEFERLDKIEQNIATHISNLDEKIKQLELAEKQLSSHQESIKLYQKYQVLFDDLKTEEKQSMETLFLSFEKRKEFLKPPAGEARNSKNEKNLVLNELEILSAIDKIVNQMEKKKIDIVPVMEFKERFQFETAVSLFLALPINTPKTEKMKQAEERLNAVLQRRQEARNVLIESGDTEFRKIMLGHIQKYTKPQEEQAFETHSIELQDIEIDAPEKPQTSALEFYKEAQKSEKTKQKEGNLAAEERELLKKSKEERGTQTIAQKQNMLTWLQKKQLKERKDDLQFLAHLIEVVEGASIERYKKIAIMLGALEYLEKESKSTFFSFGIKNYQKMIKEIKLDFLLNIKNQKKQTIADLIHTLPNTEDEIITGEVLQKMKELEILDKNADIHRLELTAKDARKKCYQKISALSYLEHDIQKTLEENSDELFTAFIKDNQKEFEAFIIAQPALNRSRALKKMQHQFDALSQTFSKTKKPLPLLGKELDTRSIDSSTAPPTSKSSSKRNSTKSSD